MKFKNLLTLALGVLSLGSNAAAQAPLSDDPRSLTIYQVMVASFIHDPDGAEGYSAMWGPDGHTKNGNLKGVISALEYIKDLGANAIWLTPIFDSSEASGGEKLQATGYFTNNYFKVDPHFGSEGDLRRLVDKAHSLGLYVFLDGVFGHHGGVTQPSPSGYSIVADGRVFSDRGPQGGSGNVQYPESLPYFKEVATWWIDKFDIDGWRLDQAYQACQGNHNYWNEIRAAVDSLTTDRKARGLKWGTLGYMVGEDWGTPEVINHGVYRNGGLLSAFDFDGKERISGPMQDPSKEGLKNGFADIITTLSAPTARGYLNDSVMPNLFLSNHDGFRLADHFNTSDPLYFSKLKERHAILAAYSGPITLYYGDEYADRSLETSGGQKDNIARTSGHLDSRNESEKDLRSYISRIMKLRQANPALWRGQAEFYTAHTDGGDVLVVTKTDSATANRVIILFPEADTELSLPGREPVQLKARVPEFIVVTEPNA